jgi:hypothetical protein
MPHSCGGRKCEPDTIYGVNIQVRITSFRISTSRKQFSNWQIMDQWQVLKGPIKTIRAP